MDAWLDEKNPGHSVIRRPMSIIDRVLIVVFITSISLPLITWVSGAAPVVSLNEKRPLALAPGWPTGDGKQWTRAAERYYDDHFGFRNLLLKWHNQANYALLRTGNKVLVGKDDWLFLERGIREDISLTPIVFDLCGQAPLTDSELNEWVAALQANHKFIEQHGARYVFMVVPNKHTLYSKFLPDQIRCTPAGSRLQQLRERLALLPDFPFLDITPALQAAADNGQRVFNQTDTHWNGNGVELAYRQLVAHLSDAGIRLNDLSAAPRRLQQFDVELSGGDLAQMLGLGDAIRETMIGIRVLQPTIRTRDNPFPGHSRDPYRQPEAFSHANAGHYASVLVFHDSFVGKSVKHVLAESFGSSKFVWNAHPRLNPELIEAAGSDLVIHQTVERALLQPFFADED